MPDLSGAADASAGLTDEEAGQRLSETLHGNERLRKENDLLSAYLQRTDYRSAQPDPTSPQKASLARNHPAKRVTCQAQACHLSVRHPCLLCRHKEQRTSSEGNIAAAVAIGDASGALRDCVAHTPCRNPLLLLPACRVRAGHETARACHTQPPLLLVRPAGCVQAARRRTHAARSTLLQAPQQALGLGRLTAEEKCEVASAEMEAVQAVADQAAAEAARALEEQAARCDAAEAALEDARRAGLAFHRAEALAAPSAGKTAAAAAGDEPSGRVRAGQEGGEQGAGARAPRPLGAEKLLRHMRERLRRLDGDVGKFALKAASAKASVRRLVAALARRDDGVDALRAVDLDQLQIENEQLLARVEQRNGDLLKLKALASQMDALRGLTAHAERLGKDLVDRRAALVQTAEDRAAAEAALERAAKHFRVLKGDAHGGAPQMMEYLRNVADVRELDTKVGEWKRKVSFASPPAVLRRASASAQ